MDTFDEARMLALKEYASLEHELCLLLKGVLQVEAPIASAIFYGISSTRARYTIIDSILEIRHPDTFHKPWNRIERWLGPRDTARNHIVHWGQDVRTIVRVDPPGVSLSEIQSVEVKLHPHLSNSRKKWRSAAEGLIYDEGALKEEFRQVRTMKHIINRFTCCVFRPDDWPWTDIFRAPIADQSAEAFLQRLNDRGFPTLPEASPH